MRKIILIFITFGLFFTVTNANFEEKAINDFKNSPSFEDLKNIKDPIIRFCEETYLKAYMRREFSDFENEVCGDFFAKKEEAEFLYKKKVLEDRGI